MEVTKFRIPFTRGSKSCTDMTPEIPVYKKVTLDENMDDKATYVRHTRSKAEETLRPEVKRKLYEDTLALGNGDSLQRNKTEKGIKRKSDDTEKRTTILTNGEHIENQEKCVRKIRRGTIIQSATVEGSQAEGGNVENQTTYLRQTRSGKFLSTPEESFRPEDDSYDFESKFIKNKPSFIRLFGEMIGMYKRTKLPEDLKPPLDVIPTEEMLTDLYNISGSIKGYAYRFCTRLQIIVLEADIEKLKPKIAEILEMHGITQGSYDIGPPIDAVSPYSKLHVCAKVKLNKTNYGSLTGFVTMQQKQQGKVSCAVASKHILDGRKVVELVNEKVNITADVVPETAPGDNHMEFDIAVAKVRKDDEKHCEGQFKNESGKFMKGMVCSYSDDQPEGQYVNIKRASTANGLGIISMALSEERKDEKELSDTNKELEDNGDSNQNETFIVVEDAPFCKEGDSRSVMYSGDEDGNHFQFIGKRTTGSYQTLRLMKEGTSTHANGSSLQCNGTETGTKRKKHDLEKTAVAATALNEKYRTGKKTDNIRQEILQQLPDERDFVIMAQGMDSKYSLLAPFLDVTQAQLDHIKEDNRTTAVRIVALLRQWAAQKAEEATFQNLATAMNWVGIDSEQVMMPVFRKHMSNNYL